MKNTFIPPKISGELHTSEIIKRHKRNPILTAKDVPYPSSLAFNPGVVKFRGSYYMVFRNDVTEAGSNCRLTSSDTGMAESLDGIEWKVWSRPLNFHYRGESLQWCDDARLTVVDEQLYISFCFNSWHGERPGIAIWRNNYDFDVVFLGVPQQRNLILCPDKINGKYWRLERPAVLYGGTFNIWIAFSPDLIHWGEQELLLGVEDVPFANVKIGGGPPPVRTDRGWLIFFHAVDDDETREITYPDGTIWKRRYTAGCALFDLNDPTKLLAITKSPILVPEKTYETGNLKRFWRENVVFPGGAIIENDNLLRLYYGSGDSNCCMAELNLYDLWPLLVPATRVAKLGTIPFQ